MRIGRASSGFLLPLLLTAPPAHAGAPVPLEDDLPGAEFRLLGVMDKEFIDARIRRTSPETNEGNQLMRFDYAVAVDVFDPLVSEGRLVLGIEARGSDSAWIFPAGGLTIVTRGRTWDADSVFVVLYDVEDGWLTPRTTALGQEDFPLSPFTPRPGEPDPVEAVRGCYFGSGKGPSLLPVLFVVIPERSRDGTRWSRSNEPFRLQFGRKESP